MTRRSDFCDCEARFSEFVNDTNAAHPCDRGAVVMTRAPGVVDVMGGIVENSGALVLTATLATAATLACWQTADDRVRIRLAATDGEAATGGEVARDLSLPYDAFDAGSNSAAALANSVRKMGCEWAAPTCLTLWQAIADGIMPRPSRGLMIVLQSDFPSKTDLGRCWSFAAATIHGLCQLFDVQADQLRKSQICAEAVMPLTGMHSVRAPMTALCGPAGGALLQLRFYPQVLCQKLELPPGITIVAAKTRLTRPTTRQRLMDTRTCAEMGQRMIAELQHRDGLRGDMASGRLATITPAEYVERYRDRLPTKISGQAFVGRFGALRGLDGEFDPHGTYKIRSRSEHHIYENRRVHEFATSIARARRTQAADALVHAGELMYASHWSHSQRCGIGGVEADQLVSAIRQQGPATGLFGAKVTAGGEGGEVVVLMRDDEPAHAALADAVAHAEAASNRRIHTYRGSINGAEFFQASELGEVVDSATDVVDSATGA